jgi:DNA-binding SARP family transcriptional activator
MRVVLSLHGSPLVKRAGRAPLPLSAREAALLAWLHLEGPTHRAPLAGRLWPGGDDAKARANLRQLLLRLRRAAGELLVEHDGLLRLAPELQVAPAAGRLLGPLEFDDAPELAEWLEARRDAERRQRLRERLAGARHALDAAHSDAAALDTALALADAALADDAAVEEAHRIRMEVFFRRNDRASAIDAWDACRHALRSAYGIAPSAATNELGRRILVAEPPPDRAADADAPVPAASRSIPQSFQRPTLLVGRAPVLADIAAALARGHGVLVAGPGGIGKSRVLAAAALEAAAGAAAAIVVGGRPGDEHLPGAVASRLVAAAIERFDPELDATTRADIRRLLPGEAGAGGPALRSALEHRRVLASVARTMLACYARGMRLVVVDDLQFADTLSLDAIAVVVGGWLADQASATQPPRTALPLFGFRAHELSAAGERLVGMLEGSRRCLRVDLAPLADAEVRALLDHLAQASGHARAQAPEAAALARALHAQVGGNPAFLLETLRGLWHEGALHWQPGQALALPDGLIGSVRQRLAALSPEALQLAQLAAVAGQDFSLALAASASGRSPLALAPVFAELDAAQVLAGTGFVHDLMAEAVRRSLPAAMLPPLHALVADHLAAHGAPPGAVAQHRAAAGDLRAAAPWWRKAAERARADWQMAEAAGLFERAAAAIESPPPAGTVADARAAASARAAALRAGRAAARCWLDVGRQAEAAHAVAEAATRVHGDGERLMVRAAELTLHFNAERYAEAADIARELATLLPAQQAILDDEELTYTLLGVALAAPYVEMPRALLALFDSIRPRADATHAPRLATRLALCEGLVLNWLGEPEAAMRRLDDGEQLARTLGATGERINLGNQRARSAELRGDVASAMLICRQTFQIGHEVGASSGLLADLRSFEALLAAAVGRRADAKALLDEVQHRAGGAHLRGYLGLRRAQTLLLIGEPAAARAAWAQLPEPPQATPQGAFRAWCEMALAMAEGAPPWEAWARAARHIPGREGQLALRQRVMQLWAAARVGVPGSGWPDAAAALAAAEVLIGELNAKGLRGLERCARGAAAVLARSTAGAARADEHAAAARALAAAVDAWCPPRDAASLSGSFR